MRGIWDGRKEMEKGWDGLQENEYGLGRIKMRGDGTNGRSELMVVISRLRKIKRSKEQSID